MDPDKAPVIRRAFELSASGLTDREVAVATGLKLTHVREVLKNPVYIGQLRTGEASGGPALVPKTLWDEVSVVRTRYARRHRGPVMRKTYAPATLRACAACGRRLTGHVGRYRHVDACAEFKAARPAVTPWKSPGAGRVKGESYKAEVYDDLVPQLLDRVRVGAITKTRVVAGPDTHPLLSSADERSVLPRGVLTQPAVAPAPKPTLRTSPSSRCPGSARGTAPEARPARGGRGVAMPARAA